MLIAEKWYVSEGLEAERRVPGDPMKISPGARDCVLSGPYDKKEEADKSAKEWLKAHPSGTPPYVWKPTE